MGKATTDQVAAVEAADQVIWSIHKQVCDSCEDHCWTIVAQAEGDLAKSRWVTALTYRTHASTVDALRHIIGITGRLARRAESRASARWLLEHQEQLW